jgi:hypothetical protein
MPAGSGARRAQGTRPGRVPAPGRGQGQGQGQRQARARARARAQAQAQAQARARAQAQARARAQAQARARAHAQARAQARARARVRAKPQAGERPPPEALASMRRRATRPPPRSAKVRGAAPHCRRRTRRPARPPAPSANGHAQGAGAIGRAAGTSGRHSVMDSRRGPAGSQGSQGRPTQDSRLQPRRGPLRSSARRIFIIARRRACRRTLDTSFHVIQSVARPRRTKRCRRTSPASFRSLQVALIRRVALAGSVRSRRSGTCARGRRRVAFPLLLLRRRERP